MCAAKVSTAVATFIEYLLSACSKCCTYITNLIHTMTIWDKHYDYPIYNSLFLLPYTFLLFSFTKRPSFSNEDISAGRYISLPPWSLGRGSGDCVTKFRAIRNKQKCTFGEVFLNVGGGCTLSPSCIKNVWKWRWGPHSRDDRAVIWKKPAIPVLDGLLLNLFYVKKKKILSHLSH